MDEISATDYVAAAGKKQNKYRNEPIEVDGHRFSSRAEARRYGELKLLERAGHVLELRLQPRYPIVVDGVPICTYVADFFYIAVSDDGRAFTHVIEDVKSPASKTPVYRLKKKLIKVKYGIDIQEIMP